MPRARSATPRRRLVLTALALATLGAACVEPSPLPTAVVIAPPTDRPSPTPIPTPTEPPLPTAIPTTTLPPVTTPVARLPLHLDVTLDPPQPVAGSEFVLKLNVTNDGDRAAHGIYIATSGPWDRYTILSVLPSGAVARDANGWHIVSPEAVPAGGGTVALEIHARADEPSDERLTFAVREADPDELRTPSGLAEVRLS